MGSPSSLGRNCICGGTYLDRGSPRVWLCVGREGKVWQAWLQERGGNGGKQNCNPEWDQEEGTPVRGCDQVDPNSAPEKEEG